LFYSRAFRKKFEGPFAVFTSILFNTQGRIETKYAADNSWLNQVSNKLRLSNIIPNDCLSINGMHLTD